MMQIVAATKNAGKLRELRRLLEPLGYRVISQEEAGVVGQAEETGSTFAENAFLKAEYVFAQTGAITLADDSGLCVDALGGRPGVYSARYGGAVGDREQCALLLGELKGILPERRTARFVCAVCVLFPDGSRIAVQESCEGVIGERPAGDDGFGYDPIFYIGGKSFAELSAEEKDTVSHRGKALRAMTEQMRKRENGNADK